MSDTTYNPVPKLAEELNLAANAIIAVTKLLDSGSTVPFIARYRKEATGGLDEVQIRNIEERRTYLLEFEERRQSIIAAITEAGKLSPELEAKINACTTKATLEDLYLPYKPKRRTRAAIAREKGLGPLAELILKQPTKGDPITSAKEYICDKVADATTALMGARDIVAEIVAENAEIRAIIRKAFSYKGLLVSSAIAKKTDKPTKFEQYYNYNEPIATVPSHRFLAVRRGEREGILKINIEINTEELIPTLASLMGLKPNSPFANELQTAISDSLTRLICPSVTSDVHLELKLQADREAVEIFASNLKNLLLSPPLGEQVVIGIDPGLRTGCKCVAVNSTGKYLDSITIYPSRGEAKNKEAQLKLISFINCHKPFAIAIGNGTGGRETETFVRHILKKSTLKEIVVISVNEAGASVYSASDIARLEFPELDITIRGAISIARRLQDPLAELVKIDPKAIGVGQYQHDVHQPLLAKKLDEVVESCVNHVGVELNTASASLLARVAGIGPSLAQKIITYRDQNGPFSQRHDLQSVSGFGPRAFEQAAGFLRIRNGKYPLDASAVHPERYELVTLMAKHLCVPLAKLIGNDELIANIDITQYLSDEVGEPTLRDIIAELKKPGRDPRKSFEPPKFRDDVQTIEDLQIGQVFEGIVTNVTAFGAFVDIGVHHDGLVHVSQLSHRFVKDPNTVVKTGDRLKVKILEIDIERKRLALTAKIEAPVNQQAKQKPLEPSPDKSFQNKYHNNQKPTIKSKGNNPKFSNNPFAKLIKN
ncbi:MAG: RNA-binding transcriptional accessory protein [Deltaproteobacteria bacterium]|nr:RNA-binding transcriptional accessory protein [Deltaproteobacteria bacterium]